MYCPIFIVALLAALIQSYESQQIQMPEAGALFQPDDEDLATQVQALQKNITELWIYIYSLRGAVSTHLNHLRQHQIELENSVHMMEHHGGGHGEKNADHTDAHPYSGEHHSHSGEHHSHSGEHSHGDQHQHSDEHQSHGGDSHSHGDDTHSHGSGGDTNSHSGEHHYHDHYHDSHSHTTGGSRSGHDDHHHTDHKDSHENEDEQQQQQTQQEPDMVVEPVVVATQMRQHTHHHQSGSSTSRSASGSGTSSGGIAPLQLMNENNHLHHYHHHDTATAVRNRSKTVVMPKFSEYGLYDFAVCNVHPNRAIPAEQQQDVVGQISLWQKKRGGPLNIHVRVQGFQMDHDHHNDHQQMQQEEDNETPVMHKHGFHIHSLGDLSNGCQSAGPHYNPKSVNHGAPNALVRHVGDLGNIECDDHGVANLVFSDDVASLKGEYAVIGKSIVIHSQADDFGLGNNEESLRTGNAGTRLACCVIEKVEKLPIRSYKSMKTAIQYKNY